MKALLQWWQTLQPREQQLVRWAGVVSVIAVFYFGLWQPLHQYRDDRQLAAQSAADQLTWLQTKLPQISTTSSAGRGSASLNDVVARSAAQFSIKVSRMQPQNEQLQLSIDDVPFEQLLRFINHLQTEQGVQLVQLDIAATEVAGTVRVRRLVLE